MTAAALRPSLFTHLFATERHNPDKGDLAASAISLLLHGSIVGGLIWASTMIKPRADAPKEEIHGYVIPLPDPERVQAAPPSRGQPPSSGSPRPVVVPPLDLNNLPDPRTLPIDETPWQPPTSEAPAASAPPGIVGDAGVGPGDSEGRGGFEIVKVLPRILNQQQVQQALVRNYPAMLRDAGIGGSVIIWLLIDEDGKVIDSELKESSGHKALDDAALRVGEVIRFSPGMNRENKVKVWVALPVTFTTRDAR